jgi:hypothetical protein
LAETDNLVFTIEDLLRRGIEEDIQAAQDQLTGYACSNFAEYSYACGQVRGLHHALVRLKEAEERVRRENY